MPASAYEEIFASPPTVPQVIENWAPGFIQTEGIELTHYQASPQEPEGISGSLKRIVDEASAVLPFGKRIRELSELKEGWDGEDAKPLKMSVLADVIEVLKYLAAQENDFREPFLAPTFDGFVQIEWHDAKRSLEIEAVHQGWSVVGTTIGRQGQRHYFTAECERSNFRGLEKFYEWFLGSELIWPSQ